jgi:hypothetical protein
MTIDELSTIKKMLSDLRWMQAASLVASGLSESKASQTYMRQITNMEKLLAEEITKGLIK